MRTNWRHIWRHIWRHMLTGALLAAPSLTGAPASGLDRTVGPERSRVLFDYWRNGRPAVGIFAVSAGEGVFDRDAPGPAALFVDIGREVAVRFDPTARPVR